MGKVIKKGKILGKNKGLKKFLNDTFLLSTIGICYSIIFYCYLLIN
jgi:hypothetical protein